MSSFIHDDFLLTTPAARRLYHEHAAGLPILDYHNHLNARELADDRQFENIPQLWLATDPYKHRVMRLAGVPEQLITGDASDREKFAGWAATVPQTLGNPLFHWTALELQRYFGISETLSTATVGRIWDQCNERLRSPEFTARALLARAKVECLCTAEPLEADLAPYARLARSDCKTRMLPSLRDAEAPDTARLDEFQRLGCRLADHAVNSFDSAVLWACAREYAQRGWSLHLHIGAQRETSTRLRRLAGPAGGYATIGHACDIAGLCRFLDGLEQEGCLPRTVLYTLHPADYAAFATLTGSFAEDGVRGKIQFGPAWWYNDHALGIRQHLDALAHYGLLSTFIGMTTDSRCLLSMSRHEYFRRVFCAWLGEKVAAGELPADLGALVRAVCYENAREWLMQKRTEK